MSFCGLDKGYGSLIVVVSMVYLEFKLNMSFDGGYRGYVAVIYAV